MDGSCPEPLRALTYRVRVSLAHTDPEIWRLLDLASDLSLLDVHRVLQHAFGWRLGRRHLFSTADPGVPTGQSLDSDSIEELDEDEITLDEVLTGTSGPMIYDYDLREGWRHLVELVEIRPSQPGDPVARLVAGERRGPLDDVGGPRGYAELLSELARPIDPAFGSTLAWTNGTLGPWQGPFDPAVLDVDAVNRALDSLFDPDVVRPSEWSDDLSAVAGRMFPGLRHEFADYVRGAHLDERVAVDLATAGVMVEPFIWLLCLLGRRGLPLTATGQLPPLRPEDPVAGLDYSWTYIDQLPRENQPRPAFDLLHHATRLGLVRAYKGQLITTAVGRRLSSDPRRLWWHVAHHWLSSVPSGGGRDACVLLAVELAVGAHTSRDSVAAAVAYGLDLLGWVDPINHASIQDGLVWELVGEQLALLSNLRVVHDGPANAPLAIDVGAQAFARAALQRHRDQRGSSPSGTVTNPSSWTRRRLP